MGAVGDFKNTRPGARIDAANAFEYVRNDMFTAENGDRPRARNYIVMLTGNERSMDTVKTNEAATKLKVQQKII